MSSKYQIKDSLAPHFITCSVVEWVDALSRPEYKDIIIESLGFCHRSKGLILYAYVLMSNHIHLIASADEGHNLSDILRDFKKFTSKRIVSAIQENSLESRKRWMMWIFKSQGERNGNNQDFQFWQQDNHPIELSTNAMMDQRLEYLHNNPVKAGIVGEPEHYLYSSAIDYSGGKGLLPVVHLG